MFLAVSWPHPTTSAFARIASASATPFALIPAASLKAYIDKLPEIAAAVAAPMANIGNITMYGEGNTAKLTGDVTKTMKQITDGFTDATDGQTAKPQTDAGRYTDVRLRPAGQRNALLLRSF